MRSSKSRSRNKSRNQRSLGNVVNRVFDSSGPEGKVRGTPQQIIEKYLALARDAQLSNDRVAEQSFLQHAEHYTRMLGEAQREQAERQAQFGGPQNGQYAEDRDERQGGQEQRRDDNRRDDNRRDDRGENRRDERRDDNRRDDRRDENRRDRRAPEPRAESQVDTQPEVQAELDISSHDALPDFLRAAPVGIPEAVSVDDEAGLVDTPETRGPDATVRSEAAVAEAEGSAEPVRRRRPAAPRRAPARKRGDADSDVAVSDGASVAPSEN